MGRAICVLGSREFWGAVNSGLEHKVWTWSQGQRPSLVVHRQLTAGQIGKNGERDQQCPTAGSWPVPQLAWCSPKEQDQSHDNDSYLRGAISVTTMSQGKNQTLRHHVCIQTQGCCPSHRSGMHSTVWLIKVTAPSTSCDTEFLDKI